MPYRDLLRETFATCEIRRVAIVDDAFDRPPFDDLQASEFGALRAALQDVVDQHDDGMADASDLLRTLEDAVGRPVQDFLGDLREEAVYLPLWNEFVKADPAGPLYSLLSPLFGVLGSDLRDKLHPLLVLQDVIRKYTAAEVTTFDSGTSADEVKGFDMVLLDFYLSVEMPAKATEDLNKTLKKKARERSIRFLSDLVQLNPERTPLVMLISSMATPRDLAEFRAEAQMMASKMAFLPKEYAASDPARAQHTILTLAKHKPQAEALVQVVQMWKDAVDEASKQLMVSVRELDLTDYSYLQKYRLASEKTPLAQYLTWLFNGQLADTVERQLKDKDIDRLVKGVHLPEPVPGLVAPSAGTARIYSAITTSRIPVATEEFQPPAWSGDIFLDTQRYNEIYGTSHDLRRRSKTMPEVMAVVTPACDLVPGRTAEAKLRTVTMIGGRLVPLGQAVHPNVHLVMLNDKPYMIMWEPKWPVTMSVDAMGPKSSMAGRYQWVGRLRDLYHAELQHRLMSDLGRVGLPVAPIMPETVTVRVLARTGTGESGYQTVLEHDAGEGAAWTFAGEKGSRSFCLRADVAWDVRRWVNDLAGGSRPTKNLKGIVGEDRYLSDMQSPVHFGSKDAVQAASSNVRYKRVRDPLAEVGTQEQANLLVALTKS